MRRTLLVMVAASLAVTHLVLEQVAAYAEVHLGAFLWKHQDTLQLFSDHNYVNRGSGRLLIYGGSETRESLLPEEIGPRVPGLHPYQHSQNEGTFEEALILLDYIERVYGDTAIPDAIVLGVTLKFVANIRSDAYPWLYAAIDRYSPYVTVDDTEHSARLLDRPLYEGVRARAAILAFQPDRYRRGVFAVASRALTHFVPTFATDRRVTDRITHANRVTTRMLTEDKIRRHLAVEPKWKRIHAWDPEQNRVAVARQFRRLRDYANRHGIELYVVNLPEISWNRELYDERKYDAYLRIVREELGPVPFLDLRTSLDDDEFYNWMYPTWQGGRRVSKRVASFIQEHRAGENGRQASATPTGANGRFVVGVNR